MNIKDLSKVPAGKIAQIYLLVAAGLFPGLYFILLFKPILFCQLDILKLLFLTSALSAPLLIANLLIAMHIAWLLIWFSKKPVRDKDSIAQSVNLHGAIVTFSASTIGSAIVFIIKDIGTLQWFVISLLVSLLIYLLQTIWTIYSLRKKRLDQTRALSAR